MRRRKLTDQQLELARVIAKQRRETPTNAEIAAEFGVSEELIKQISRGHKYAHEEGDFYDDEPPDARRFRKCPS